MQRPGTDPDNMQSDDFLCDFCHKPWHEDRPMIEGHKGSCVCGDCLTIAFLTVVAQKHSTAPAGYTCTLCLEERDQRAWTTPLSEDATICERCIRQASQALGKDSDTNWSRPPVS